MPRDHSEERPIWCGRPFQRPRLRRTVFIHTTVCHSLRRTYILRNLVVHTSRMKNHQILKNVGCNKGSGHYGWIVEFYRAEQQGGSDTDDEKGIRKTVC